MGRYILDNIPITVDNFSVLRYYNFHGFRTIVKNQSISEINVIIEDGLGRQIDIQNYFSLTLEFNVVVNSPSTFNKNNLKDFETIQKKDIGDDTL